MYVLHEKGKKAEHVTPQAGRAQQEREGGRATPVLTVSSKEKSFSFRRREEAETEEASLPDSSERVGEPVPKVETSGRANGCPYRYVQNQAHDLLPQTWPSSKIQHLSDGGNIPPSANTSRLAVRMTMFCQLHLSEFLDLLISTSIT